MAVSFSASQNREVISSAFRSCAESFDPSRSAVAWLLGIAALLLKKRRRDEIKDRRCTSATLLGEEAWAKALERRCTNPGDVAVADHLDIEQALCRLSPNEQRAIKLRYYDGLDGEELASGLEAPTPGAARVRVCRALESLRKQFSLVKREVLS